ncbi:hypothetical protein Tco_0396154 [Tanacetum coccineum]
MAYSRDHENLTLWIDVYIHVYFADGKPRARLYTVSLVLGWASCSGGGPLAVSVRPKGLKLAVVKVTRRVFKLVMDVIRAPTGVPCRVGFLEPVVGDDKGMIPDGDPVSAL